MAHVISRLWKAQNQDLMILPGSLPLDDGQTRNERTSYLAPGWDPVIERDIDGDRAETEELERKEPRFGAVNAAHRVARTVFLGSAPSSGGAQKGLRGVDRGRVLLGCLQPGQSAVTFTDALNRLCDRLHYLNLSGDKMAEATRFWFDTRANLRREMEDRKGRFDDRAEVRAKIAEALKRLAQGSTLFEGVHIFTSSGDIPDDSALRLVFLSIDKAYTKQEAKMAEDEVLEIVRSNGSKPRYRANRLVFLAADQGSLIRLRDAIRTALSWGSIVDDVKGERLNVDRLQEEQAKKELMDAEGAVPKLVRECFKVAALPADGLGHGPASDGRGVRAPRGRTDVCRFDRASVPGQRAGHLGLVANPPAGQAARAVLEGHDRGGARGGGPGGHAAVSLHASHEAPLGAGAGDPQGSRKSRFLRYGLWPARRAVRGLQAR